MRQKNHKTYYKEWTCHANEEVEPVQTIQIKIYQSNTYRKDLSWLYFDDESRTQESQQVKYEQLCIPISAAYLTYPNQLLFRHLTTAQRITRAYFLFDYIQTAVILRQRFTDI